MELVSKLTTGYGEVLSEAEMTLENNKQRQQASISIKALCFNLFSLRSG